MQSVEDLTKKTQVLEKRNEYCLVLREQGFLKENSVVMMAWRIYLFPFRTQKSSSIAPRVVGGSPPVRVGRCHALCGSSSVVEHHLAMVGVAGSNPVFRFFCTLIYGMKNL